MTSTLSKEMLDKVRWHGEKFTGYSFAESRELGSTILALVDDYERWLRTLGASTGRLMDIEELKALQLKILGPLIQFTKEHPPLITGDAFDDTWLNQALVVGGVIEVRFHHGFTPNGELRRFGAVAVFDTDYWASLVGHGLTPLVALQNALLDAEATCNRP